MELIDRAAVIAAMKSYCAECDSYSGVRCRSCGYMDAMDKVDEVPTVDAVEVVRCRDCELFDTGGICYWCNLFDAATMPDDYCSRGVKHFSEAGKVVVAKKETTTGEDINVHTNGGE